LKIISLFVGVGFLVGFQGWVRPQENPNGILQQSPGLRGTSYPGKARPIENNPARVAARGNGQRNKAATPLGL